MTKQSVTTYLVGMCFILTSTITLAQQSEIEYNSDTGAAGPHLLLQESGDSGAASGADGWSRLWFKNTADATNRWGFLARPHNGATDNDGVLTSPLVMAYTGIQKFGFGSDGTLRINKEYSLPNMDGTNGQVLTTNGSGIVSWTDGGSSSPWSISGANVYRAAGSVGIGETSPSDPLHITSSGTTADIRIEASGDKNLSFYEGTTQKGYIGHGGTHLNIVNDETNGDIVIDAQDDIKFYTDNNTTAALPNLELLNLGGSTTRLSLRGSSGTQLNFMTNNSITGFINHNSFGFRINKSAGAGNMEITSNNKIVVGAEGKTTMVIEEEKVTIGSGIIPSQKLDVPGKIEIADDTNPATGGAMRYLNGKFEGYNGTEWLPLSSPKTVTKVINSHDLNAGRNTDDFILINNYAYFLSSASQPALFKTLPVPVGATIKKVSLVAMDNETGTGPNERIRLTLYKNTTAAGAMATNTSLGIVRTNDTATNIYGKFDIPTSTQFNNNSTLGPDECFYLYIVSDNGGNPGTWPGSALRISKIVIEYETP